MPVPGLYSKTLTKDEQALYLGMKMGSIDEELRLLRVLLLRALDLKEKIENADLENTTDGFTLVENKEVIGGENSGSTKIWKRPDVDTRISELVKQVAVLEKLRTELLANAGSDGEGLAQKILQAVTRIRKVERAHPEMD